jgi:hypothetical protein
MYNNACLFIPTSLHHSVNHLIIIRETYTLHIEVLTLYMLHTVYRLKEKKYDFNRYVPVAKYMFCSTCDYLFYF